MTELCHEQLRPRPPNNPEPFSSKSYPSTQSHIQCTAIHSPRSFCSFNPMKTESSESHIPPETSTTGGSLHGEMIDSCPVCGGIVSKKAQTCPHCGHPLQQLTKRFNLRKWKTSIHNWLVHCKSRLKTLTHVAGLFLLFAACSLLCWFGGLIVTSLVSPFLSYPSRFVCFYSIVPACFIIIGWLYRKMFNKHTSLLIEKTALVLLGLAAVGSISVVRQCYILNNRIDCCLSSMTPLTCNLCCLGVLFAWMAIYEFKIRSIVKTRQHQPTPAKNTKSLRFHMGYTFVLFAFPLLLVISLSPSEPASTTPIQSSSSDSEDIILVRDYMGHLRFENLPICLQVIKEEMPTKARDLISAYEISHIDIVSGWSKSDWSIFRTLSADTQEKLCLTCMSLKRPTTPSTWFLSLWSSWSTCKAIWIDSVFESLILARTRLVGESVDDEAFFQSNRHALLQPRFTDLGIVGNTIASAGCSLVHPSFGVERIRHLGDWLKCILEEKYPAWMKNYWKSMRDRM